MQLNNFELHSNDFFFEEVEEKRLNERQRIRRRYSTTDDVL